MSRTSFAVACAATLVAAPLAAQSSAQPTSARSSITSGFFLGLNFSGSSLRFDGDGSEAESGSGVGFQLGWGITPRFALFTDVNGAAMNTDGAQYGLGHFDLGMRYSFARATSRWVPFLEGAVSARAVVQEDVEFVDGNGNPYTADMAMSGPGYTLGGGVQYHLAPNWALGTSLKWTKGEFTSVQVDNVTVDGFELDATSTRFNLGLTWYPAGGR